MNLRNLFLCLLNTLFMCTGQILFKIGSNGQKLDSISNIIKLFISPIILFALFLYGFSTILWLYILSKIDLSFAYPIQALAFPLVLIASSVILHEQISVNRWIGIIIIFIGIYIALH